MQMSANCRYNIQNSVLQHHNPGSTMTNSLLERSAWQLPEDIKYELDDGIATCCAFNRKGSMLAVGCNDGRIVIWDVDTRGQVQALVGHVQTVESVSWSRSSRRLLSASLDHKVVIWNSLTGEKLRVVNFQQPILKATFQPRNHNQILVSPLAQEPFLLTLKEDQEDERQSLPLHGQELVSKASSQKPEVAALAVFNRAGDRIAVGTPLGMIHLIQTSPLKLLKSINASGRKYAIKDIQFSYRGDEIVVAGADKLIRTFESNSLEPLHRIQDTVNRVKWRCCMFSPNGNCIIAGAIQGNDHKMYIWDREDGNLIKILEGPKEDLVAMAYHPQRPMMVSVSSLGTVFLWSVTYTENWSAFAPDFKEIEDNVEYIEREDEFDEVDGVAAKSHAMQIANEPVDIVTPDNNHYASSEEEALSEEELSYIPVVPIDDSPATQKAADFQITKSIPGVHLEANDSQERARIRGIRSKHVPADRKRPARAVGSVASSVDGKQSKLTEPSV